MSVRMPACREGGSLSGILRIVSEENVAIVRQMLELASEQPQALYDLLAEDVEWDASAVGPLEFAACRGRDNVMEFFRRWAGTFEDWDFETEEVVDAGDSVVVRIHQWGRGKGSGIAAEDRFWQVWTLRDGRAIRTTHFRDKADALASVGISE
jgi:ketosteroid isomerase-like protein